MQLIIAHEFPWPIMARVMVKNDQTFILWRTEISSPPMASVREQEYSLIYIAFTDDDNDQKFHISGWATELDIWLSPLTLHYTNEVNNVVEAWKWSLFCIPHPWLPDSPGCCRHGNRSSSCSLLHLFRFTLCWQLDLNSSARLSFILEFAFQYR